MADVELSFGASGLAELTTGFNSALQIWGRFSGAIQATVRDLGQMQHAQRAANVSIDEAQRATEGLVDDMAILRMNNTLAFAGIQLNEHALRSATVAAIDYARSHGVTAAQGMEQLTAALVSGRSRGL